MLTNLRVNREIMAAWKGESGAAEPPPAARDDPDDDEPRVPSAFDVAASRAPPCSPPSVVADVECGGNCEGHDDADEQCDQRPTHRSTSDRGAAGGEWCSVVWRDWGAFVIAPAA